MILNRKNMSDMCKRLLALLGFGPLVSQAIKSWMGDGKQFRRRRDASAALGLVPRQFSTGGKQVMCITKNQFNRHINGTVFRCSIIYNISDGCKVVNFKNYKQGGWYARRFSDH